MTTSRTLRVLSAAAVVLLSGGVAWAADETYRSKNSGGWGNYAEPYTWEVFRNNQWVNVTAAADIPNEGDTVTINNTGAGDPHLITVSNAQGVMSLTLSSNGRLEIDGSAGTAASLNFNGSGTPALAITPVDGVKLVEYATLQVSKSMSVTGAGSIKGLDDTNCTIAIGSTGTVELELNVLVYGELQIVGVGTKTHEDQLENKFRIEATTGTISLASSLESVTDAAEAVRWKAGASGAVVQFDKSVSGLNGHFEAVIGSTLRFNADVTTAGDLIMACDTSTVDVNNGARFDFDTFSGSCNGPPVAGIITADFNCTGCDS